MGQTCSPSASVPMPGILNTILDRRKQGLPPSAAASAAAADGPISATAKGPAASSPPRGKTMDERAMIRQAFLASPAFVAEKQLRMLTDTDMDAIIDAMATRTLSAKGEVLFKEGSPADECYVVRTGFLHVVGKSKWGTGGGSSSSSRDLPVASPGDLLSETEFLAGNVRRPATVQATVGVGATVFVLAAADYRRIVAREDGMEQRAGDLKKLGLFKGLTEGQLRVLQRQIAVKDVTRGDLILRAGEAIRVLYIIQKGTVKVIDQADRIKQLGAGDFFGDECLSVFQQRSPKTYVAISDATLLGVNKETFDDEELFGAVCDKIEREAGARRRKDAAAKASATSTSPALPAQPGTPETAASGTSKSSGSSNNSNNSNNNNNNNYIFDLPLAFPNWNSPWN